MKIRMPMLALLAVTAFLLAVPGAAGPWRAGERNSYGWRLMTPDERVEHQRRLRGFETYEECSAYLAEHHAQMSERARQRGIVLTPRTPTACDELRAAGGLK